MGIRGLFVIVGLACLFLVFGCGEQTIRVIHEGGETHKVIHEPQDINVKPWRERRRHPNQPPK